jgi:hypothetical protein
MKDIGVSMCDEVLEHKKRDGRGIDGRYCFWAMKVPQNVDLDKLWVANHGKWVGYFNIFDWTDSEVHFYSDSWIDDVQGERKPFMGFTYKVPQQKSYIKI